MHPAMWRAFLIFVAWCGAAFLAGCATRAADVAPAAVSPLEFSTWDCTRIDDERDKVQQRAADLAWSVDQHVANNILALGVGAVVFWPAMLALRGDGPEAADLARLKGRHEALGAAAHDKACPPPGDDLPAARAAALPVALGEKFVYEDRSAAKGPAHELAMRVTALRRGEIEYQQARAAGAVDAAEAAGAADAAAAGLWLQDRAGNVTSAPVGALRWPHLLRAGLALGAVTAGDIEVVGDPWARARMRGQVVAVGAQTVAGRRFDAAVIELFGDAPRGDSSTRVEGVIVVDRHSGILLRLDLRSAQGSFSLQRRLVRVETGADTPR